MDRCFGLLLAWPDRLNPADFPEGSPEQIAVLIRLNQLRLAEVHLLARSKARDPEIMLALLAQIRLLQGALPAVESISATLDQLLPDHWLARWTKAHLWMQQGKMALFHQVPANFWSDSGRYPLLLVAQVAERLANHDLVTAARLLATFPVVDSPEFLRLKAGFLKAQSQYLEAFGLLRPCLERAPQLLHLQTQVFELALLARSMPDIIPIARQAILQHGEHPELLNNVSAVKLYQRQPGFSRRCSLLLSTWASLGFHKAGLPNLICSYEQCGQADWIEYLHPAIWNQPLVNTDLTGNLVLHLASIQSPRYQTLLKGFVSAFQRSAEFQKLLPASPRSAIGHPDGHLSVAWIGADFTPHPVSRFLQHFFAASHGMRNHRHYVVSLLNHGALSNLDTFASMPGVNVLDVSSLYASDRVTAIRDLNVNVAIDLSGWTGGHFATGYLARLAPVQVNYLGYFASTGLPSMDYWLGDANLFPPDQNEWHTEKLWKLQRPFLAWQPPVGLPEASVSVAEPPSGAIRFGSFNNNRKLSDQSLNLWAQILDRVPDSRLVLKANAGDDTTTQELLARRMRRQGLDPERVEWLSLTARSEEHLMQYRHIDIALDPLPNGGCTTTCEALWMGCPVITIAGSHYVSRMSTAVLRGAGLSDWVASNAQDYVRMAVDQASTLQWLRSHRERWRQTLALSPLGDAADLMRHLEKAFTEMAQTSMVA